LNTYTIGSSKEYFDAKVSQVVSGLLRSVHRCSI
jgi:hypothetical protein